MTWAFLTRIEKTTAIRNGVAWKLTASRIGEELGCSHSAILGFAFRNKIKMLSRAKSRMAEVVALRRADVKPKEIAFRLSLNISTVYRHLSNAKALDRAWEARRGT